ncbi:MAG: TauD/TfdA family dioxygenase [Gammaproteobacteria bacterium]|nr:TauD/TfdA family dioxygenase [Gammaproteobacteria bacterium]
MSYLDLDDHKAYQKWVGYKQSRYELRSDSGFSLLNAVEPDGTIPEQSLTNLKTQVSDYNFSLYKMLGPAEDHLAVVKKVGSQMGLQQLDKNLCAREDRITRLSVVENGRPNHYIPYSNKAIGWHTDGYYNPMQQRVQAMVLHCEQPAAAGGENQLLDHEMAYIHLRNENPDFIRALSQPAVMCIPENIENGELLRAQTCSAVFMEEQGHALNMRYSRRKHNIIWSDDVLTQEALDCLDGFLESDSPYHVRYRLNQGEGVMCNNVLHTRTAFTDSAEHKRVYYRARYYNRIEC